MKEHPNGRSKMDDNHRTSPRHEFPYEQLVAAVTDGNMPSVRDFRAVPCEDVSRSGIAFFLETKPSAKEYIFALGKPPRETYMCARVVHVRPVRHNGQRRYRVGCRFTGRAGFERRPPPVGAEFNGAGEGDAAAQQEVGE